MSSGCSVNRCHKLGVTGIGTKKIVVRPHKMGNCRRVAAKFVGNGTIWITLFHQQRSTGTAHITNNTAARGRSARRTAQVFVQIGNAKGKSQGVVIEEHLKKRKMDNDCRYYTLKDSRPPQGICFKRCGEETPQ
jgi:hypothetical protein